MTDLSGQSNVSYYPSGIIKSYVTLIEDEFLINDQFVKAAEGTEITFHENGKIKRIQLASKTRLKLAKGNIIFQQNEKVDFLEDGTVKIEMKPEWMVPESIFSKILKSIRQMF